MLRRLITVLIVVFITSPALASDKEKRNVYVGVYLEDISAFDLTQGRFKADLYIWCRWSGSKEPPNIVLGNAEVSKREEIEREDDYGWNSIRWRVQGTFRGTFPVHKFPFDNQRLPIDLVLASSEGTLIPDTAASGRAETFSITGWTYEPYFQTDGRPVEIASDLGSIVAEGERHHAGQVTFFLQLRRPFASTVLKFVVPLATFLMIALSAFLVPIHVIPVRASVTITALLSIVALQFAQSRAVPPVAYVVTADKMFLGCFLVLLVALVTHVLMFRLRESRPSLVARANGVVPAVLGAVIVTAGIVLVRPSPVVSEAHASLASGEGPPAPVLPVSAKDSLTVSGIKLKDPKKFGRGLLYRGLEHLVVELPQPTNDLVRFLPDGGMQVRWRLKPDMAWSDGSPIRAGDIAASLRQREELERRGVKVVDSLTVEVDYAKRYGWYLLPFPIIPEHGAGDGPYRMIAFEKGKSAELEVNPHFTGAAPLIRSITLTTAPDPSADLQFSPTLVKAIARNPAGRHFRARTPMLILQPDLSVEQYKDITFRRAIATGINRRRIAHSLGGDDSVVAHSYYPPWSPGYHHLPLYPHSADNAVKQLEQINRADPPPTLKLLSRKPRGQGEDRLHKRIAQDLADSGFVTTWEYVEDPKALFQAGNHGGLLLHWQSGFWDGVGGSAWNQMFEKDAAPGFDKKVLTKLLDRNKSTVYPDHQKVLTVAVQTIWVTTLPMIPIAYTVERKQAVTTLKNFDPFGGPKGISPWWNVETWYFDDSTASRTPAP